MAGLSETDRKFSPSGSVVDHLENVFKVRVDVDRRVVEKVFNFEMAGFVIVEDEILHVRWLSEDEKEMNIIVGEGGPEGSEVVRLRAYIAGEEKPEGFGMVLLSVTTDHSEYGDSAVIFVGSNSEGEEVHLRVLSNGFESEIIRRIEPIQAMAA